MLRCIARWSSYLSHRVLSRVCVVPFRIPSITPETEEQQSAFDALEDMLDDHRPSSAIGWAISQRDELRNKAAIREMKALLKGPFQGRTTGNWALVLVCTKQVSIILHSHFLFLLCACGCACTCAHVCIVHTCTCVHVHEARAYKAMRIV